MNTLKRIDDTTWCWLIPSDDKTKMVEVHLHGEIYEIVQIASNIIANLGLQKIKEQTTLFQIDKLRSLAGRWQISLGKPDEGIIKKFLQWIPFTHTIPSKNIIDIHISKELTNNDSIINKITQIFNKTIKESEVIHISNFDITKTKRAPFNPEATLSERLKGDPFTDAFTFVATDAFQHWEPYYVHQKEINGKYSMALHDGMVSLRINRGFQDNLEDEQLNRDTTQAFKKFSVEEYGETVLQYIQYQFEFDLDKLISSGEPLQPEHVYRMNIGANNLEMENIECLYQKLQNLQVDIASVQENISATAFFEQYVTLPGQGDQFTLRELKGIMRLLRNNPEIPPTIKELKLWLKDFFNNAPLTPDELSADKFNILTSILITPKESWSRQFTGREITHLPIMGFYTIAERNHFKPWLDLQELLQIYTDYENREDWENFCELLTHVASKKHLVHLHPIDKWRVGGIIPGPSTAKGNRRWYRVESCLDDNRGDFNYTLVPACQDSSLPHIKLYRSTASDRYAMNGYTSLQADLTPFSSPGGCYNHLQDEYEMPFFKERTIPIWVGYLIFAQEHYVKFLERVETKDLHINHFETMNEEELEIRFKRGLEDVKEWQKIVSEYERGMILLLNELINQKFDTPLFENLNNDPKIKIGSPFSIQSLNEQLVAIQSSDGVPIPEILSSTSIEYLIEKATMLKHKAEEYHQQLLFFAKYLHEMPDEKIACDIAFLGHSLGGALCQGALSHFCVETGRIPLPHHNYLCYASDAPAISSYEAEQFMEFIENHQELLKKFDQKWKIVQQMEYGDFVPQSGSIHLGATQEDLNKYETFLNIKVRVFRPLETAETKEIKNAPTHGRRVGLAIEGRDYKFTYLTPAALWRFDHSYWLNSQQQDIWGYRLFKGPKLTEAMRKLLGILELPSQLFWEIWSNVSPPPGMEMRDSNKVFYCHYKKPLIINNGASVGNSF